jgi:hypothetical protein
MEQIVHGQLYYYGLRLSPAWFNTYSLCSSLIYYGYLLPPMVLSGVALILSFITETDEVPQRMKAASRRPMPPQAAKVESRPVVKEVPGRGESGKRKGISCPNCKKVFSRALVMLDFSGGTKRMVSVCPYCNYVLGNTSDERGFDENVQVAQPDKKIIH